MLMPPRGSTSNRHIANIQTNAIREGIGKMIHPTDALYLVLLNIRK